MNLKILWMKMAIKNPPNLLGSMDSFVERGLMRRKEFFSILSDNYTTFTLKED